MNRYLVLALLGLLTALATVVNNLFSPAMPSLALELGCDASMVQLCLTASLLGLALGHIVIGPLSDRLGRRAPLLWSMATYVVTSAALVMLPGVETMIALRLLQGAAAGGGIVISRSVAADMAVGGKLMKMLAAINVINGIMPIVTPMLGGALTTGVGATGPFWGMLVAGVVLLVGCWFLGETLPANRRSTKSWLATMRLFDCVAHNGEVMATIFHQAGALIVLFANIAFTPFLLSSEGYGPEAIGIALGINGIFTALGAGFAPALGDARRGILVSAVGLMVLGLLQAVLLWSHAGLWPYEVVTCLMLVMVGVTLTSSSSHAMELARHVAGTASAVLGAVGFVVAAVVPPLTTAGDKFHNTALIFLAGPTMALLFAILQRHVASHHQHTKS